MNEYQEGTKSSSPCAFCDKIVPATLTNVTLSLCKGLEEVENVLVRICDECGNKIAVPAQSLPSIQQAMKRLVESGVESDRGNIPVELKSIVEREKRLNREIRPDYQEEYPLEAAE